MSSFVLFSILRNLFYLIFTLGTIAGVTLMCLLQAGRQADEQFSKFFDKEGGSDE